MMEKKTDFILRMGGPEDWDMALLLAWKTFLKFEAEEYGRQGTDSFRDFLCDSKLKQLFLKGKYQMLIAMETGKPEKIIGMITWRNINHISLLFVEEQCHRQGIGRALVRALGEHLRETERRDTMTVDASPYAVAFYQRLGFRILGEEQECEGIRYTPMEIIMKGD